MPTEFELRKEAREIFLQLCCTDLMRFLQVLLYPKNKEDKIKHIIYQMHQQDHTNFDLQIEEFSDMQIMTMMKIFEERKNILTIVQAEGIQKRLNTIIQGLKNLSPHFLLKFESYSYEKASQDKKEPYQQLKKEKWHALDFYRTFFQKKDNGKTVFPASPDAKAAEIRQADLLKRYPNAFQWGKFTNSRFSHVYKTIAKAEELYANQCKASNKLNLSPQKSKTMLK